MKKKSNIKSLKESSAPSSPSEQPVSPSRRVVSPPVRMVTRGVSGAVRPKSVDEILSSLDVSCILYDNLANLNIFIYFLFLVIIISKKI